MIRVFATSSAEWLDLAPDAEFEIEISNPLFDSEGTPVAVSTSISFPPSATNCRVFDYLPAIFLPPKVTKLSAAIFFDGIPILSGILAYDQTDESGNLQYLFAERELNDSLEKKLYELEHLRGAVNVQDLINDRIEGVGVPRLYDPEKDSFRNNAFGRYDKYVTPCVNLQLLFAETEALSLDPTISNLFGELWILGQQLHFAYGLAPTIADGMPDRTLMEILQIFCKMTCSFVFSQKNGYTVLPFNKIITLSPVAIDDVVSDRNFTSSKESAQGYKFGFSSDPVATNTDLEESDQESASSYKGVMDAASDEDEYKAVLLSTTGELFSVPPKKEGSVRPPRPGEPSTGTPAYNSCDILSSGDEYEDSEIDGEAFDSQADCELAKAVPVRLSMNSDNSSYFLATRVSFSSDGAKRDSSVIIGKYAQHQLTGHGITFNSDGTESQVSDPITARTLFSEYHTAFKAWVGKDRQVLKVDAVISPSMLYEFQIWRRVILRNRLFFVRKINMRLSVKDGQTDSSMELVSL